MTIQGGWEIYLVHDVLLPMWCAKKGDIVLRAWTKYQLEQLLDKHDANLQNRPHVSKR